MKGIAVVVEDLHAAEVDLHLELRRAAERNCTDQEVTDTICDLARLSARHVEDLAREGVRFGLDLGTAARSTNRVAAGLRRKTSELMGRRQTSAVLLVNDLRQIYGNASLVQLDWELLAELARVDRDEDLLALAESCRAETVRQLTWAETKLKESVVEALATPDRAG